MTEQHDLPFIEDDPPAVRVMTYPYMAAQLSARIQVIIGKIQAMSAANNVLIASNNLEQLYPIDMFQRLDEELEDVELQIQLLAQRARVAALQAGKPNINIHTINIDRAV